MTCLANEHTDPITQSTHPKITRTIIQETASARPSRSTVNYLLQLFTRKRNRHIFTHSLCKITPCVLIYLSSTVTNTCSTFGALFCFFMTSPF